jgi:UDP-2,3-diacylglucosamine hydrolase
VKPVYFIADAHLGIESEALEEAKERDLLALLAHLRGRSSVVYLVGDIFDFWFEFRRPEHSAHEEVLSALRELVESGARIRFLGGNHDYWAGPRFEELTGATVHRTPAVDTHFGKKVFVAHGDGLPKGDWSYKLLKAVIRSPLAIAGFRLFSPAAGAAIGRWASGLSEVTEERILRALPAMKGFLESKLREGYDVAVVGHVHRQMLWESEGGIAVVVGDWMKHRSVIELTQDGLRPMAWVDGALVEETPAGS